MASRRKRKRKRRNAEATAASTHNRRGGWGQGLPVAAADMLLVRQAIREGWPVAPEVRSAVVSDISLIAREEGAERRRVVAAIRVLLAAAKSNRKLELEHMRERHVSKR